MSKPLVVVESPTKAKTIGKFLGKRFKVLASYGHVRDLPNNAAEIPESIKKEKWSRLGINVDHDFEPLYIIPEQKKKRVSDLKEALKDADELYLATDEDREGESISWHLVEVLKPKIPTKRLVFHEITKEAIDEALAHSRAIDENLVRAQETRRTIDRLFGYSVSPVLWKKMAPRLSAGRVQSVAMRLLVERERERIRFRSGTYWDLKGIFANHENSAFEAELTYVGERRVAIGKDFDPQTGTIDEKVAKDVVLLDEKGAGALRERLLKAKTEVASIEEKPYSTRPSAPFTTSTLQQEASRKLNFAVRRTMQVAQLLYENGFITYMRTDSTTLSAEALSGARTLITREFGAEYLFPEPRVYQTKVKNAQEAHEAIRPAGASFEPPAVIREKLGDEAFRLYELIWKRTIASQMKDAVGTRVTVEISCADATFRASGKTITFPGFLRAYVEGADDPEAEIADKEKVLPPLKKGEALKVNSLEALGHETQPPARFTEGSLIKELERLGIGRPSTWATIVDVVLNRQYAFKKGTALVPTFLALGVTGLMERYFTDLLNYEFTANLEDDLDAISRGEMDNLKYLNKFYFGNGHAGLIQLVKNGEEKIDPREINGIPLGVDSTGRAVEVRIGRFGPFLTNGTDRASVPDGVAPDEMTIPEAEKILIAAAKGPASLGSHPTAQVPIYLKTGRFGPYLQLGDAKEGEKPKMASLLPGQDPAQVTLEIAVKILELPKNIGKNPETNDDIIVANGRFGPYLKSGTDTRSIPVDEVSPIEITLEKALEILKRPKTRGRGAAQQPKKLKELGNHPTSNLAISLRSGRYGPYVTDGEVNASLPKGSNPDSLTLAEAVQLIDARAAAGPPKKRRAKKKSKKVEE